MKLVPALRCRSLTLNLASAALFSLVLNSIFLVRAIRAIPFETFHDYLFAASLPLVLSSAFFAILSLLSLPWLRKPLLTILILISVAASYFIWSFGTVIDTNMLQNLFEIDIQEATALVSLRLVLWMLAGAGIPLLLLWRIKIVPATAGGGRCCNAFCPRWRLRCSFC